MTDQPTSAQKLPFSQRYGLAPTPTPLFLKDISKELWRDLFNTLQLSCQKSMQQAELASDIWMHFFHEPISEIPRSQFTGNVSIAELIEGRRITFESEQERGSYVLDCRIYDLIEFVYASQHSHSIRESLQKDVNQDFKRDFASVQMIDGLVTPISDEEQSRAIEAAMQGPLENVNSQVRTALALLADRENPNYRDSVKNSISAVESLCKHIVGDSKATLEDALKTIEATAMPIHPALKEAFRKLYAYAGDVARHGLMGSDNLDVEDARHMLVTCSAFINYLVVKADKAGIKL